MTPWKPASIAHPTAVAVVDQSALEVGRVGGDRAGRGILVARVVLHVPEVGVRHGRLRDVAPVLDRLVQADEVADVGVEADDIHPDVLDEAHGGRRGAEVGVLVHLERQQHPDLAGVASELAEALHREIPGRRRRRPGRGARRRSRTRAASRCSGVSARCSPTETTPTPELGREIDAAVAVGEVVLARPFVDDAPADHGEGCRAQAVQRRSGRISVALLAVERSPKRTHESVRSTASKPASATVAKTRSHRDSAASIERGTGRHVGREGKQRRRDRPRLRSEPIAASS